MSAVYLEVRTSEKKKVANTRSDKLIQADYMAGWILTDEHCMSTAFRGSYF